MLSDNLIYFLEYSINGFICFLYDVTLLLLSDFTCVFVLFWTILNVFVCLHVCMTIDDLRSGSNRYSLFSEISLQNLLLSITGRLRNEAPPAPRATSPDCSLTGGGF